MKTRRDFLAMLAGVPLLGRLFEREPEAGSPDDVSVTFWYTGSDFIVTDEHGNELGVFQDDTSTDTYWIGPVSTDLC